MREHLPALAQHTADLRVTTGRPVIVGISGGQGSGKSTLALFLQAWLQREAGLRCTHLSLDDLYLDRRTRHELAARVHPLLETRGVPGTHDVGLAHELLDALTDAASTRALRLPVFDKALDDRLPKRQWRLAQTPVDVLLFEGWCVGAPPQAPAELIKPVNALETEADLGGTWRRYVNQCLETDYAELFARLDALVLLRVPGWSKVLEWRRLQESRLRVRMVLNRTDARTRSTQTDEQLERFVMHFERLTKHMLSTLPALADTVIDIDVEHRLARRVDRGWRTGSRPLP
jgi:D-glycerate 3-kinase